MIGKLTGNYGGGAGEGAIVVDVGGVGYVVRVPTHTSEALSRLPGPLSLYIHTAVRDDAIDLYGFPTEIELSFFKQLMSVSGIGPKTAMGILATADVGSLRRAIAQGDAVTLIKVFGIGKKSAERLVVELRDKLSNEGAAAGAPEATEGSGDVLEALVALGYGAQESRQALQAVAPSVTTTAARVAAALRLLGSRIHQ